MANVFPNPASPDSTCRPLVEPPGEGTVARAVCRAQQALAARQYGEGYWCGELEGDSILQSEYLLLLAWLGREGSLRAHKVARYLLRQQQAHGGWSQYPGGPLDISGSVKAYFALKLTGHDPEAPSMQAACAAIRAHGGADAVNSFTRFYLALLGQIGYEHCPAVPPEAVLLPAWAPINIYKVSAWSRTILVPLAIMWAYRPARELPDERGIAELFLQPPSRWPALRCPGLPRARAWLSWERTFRLLDGTLKLLERCRIRPLRRLALARAERWMTERFVESDGLGAIFPPMIWSIVALKCLGYDERSVEWRYCLEQLEGLVIEDNETVRLQPCKSPVWDTALSLRALAASERSERHGAEDQAPVNEGARQVALAQRAVCEKAIDWLLRKEVTRSGDWAKTVRGAPGGWFFEHHNAFYPDVDDTAMVLLALREQFAGAWQVDDSVAAQVVVQGRFEKLSSARRQAELVDRARLACQRGKAWIEAMQNRDGGWGAFDRNNDREFLCHVPFADHNAMIDPSTPDLAARVLESLGALGARAGEPAIDRGLAYLRQTQESDGAWFGRWGINYIYGTWQVLVGMRAVGVPANDPAVVRGAQFLLSCQQPSGGWGESVETYERPELRGRGKETASQTAWALLGLMAAGQVRSPAVGHGIRYLLEQQQPNGLWHEPEFTGTGFPRVFYLRYHLYPLYFPLLALATWARLEKTE